MHGYNLRFTFGQGTGFIKDQRVESAGALQGVGITHQHAKLGGATHAGDNRHRRRKAERARTGDNQYRGGDHQGIDNLRRRAEEIPDSRAQQRDAHYYRHKNGGDFIGQLTYFRLTALCLAHHADNTGQRGVSSHRTGGEQHAAVLHHRTGMHAITL